jgi:lysyl-tRNA synthetase class 1
MPEHIPDTIPRAWPFEEAQKIAVRSEELAKREVLFETGYGPSGLPHIGTFGEVARTSWVRHAYTVLTGKPSRLLAFSDDMDGLRKVPDNVPNRDMLRQHLGKPLTRIPDPFGKYESFGHHNNAMLRRFLDRFGFAYEFASASDYYTQGRFDAALRRVLEAFDEITAVILPTLGPERRATYSPILPIHPKTGVVEQVHIDRVDPDAATIFWTDAQGARHETSVLGGHAKCQWKADWAMRWFALGVDYEMSGKDLIDSVKLSGEVCRVLGARPPIGFTYELFLDERGQKISKSRGNGLGVDDWLRYGPPESLAQFMYNQPHRAKKLFFDVIPRAADEYIGNIEKSRAEDDAARQANPVWHIHRGAISQGAGSPIPFSMLLNLASVINAETPDMLWGFIQRYNPAATPASEPFLARLVEHAIAYFQDFVRPKKRFRQADAAEREALEDLAAVLRGIDPRMPAEEIQDFVYAVGKRHKLASLKAWFGCLYQVLLGQDEGPRFGGFVALYGVRETVALIETALARADVEVPA